VFVYYFVPFSDVFILHESWAFFDYVEEQIRLHILVNVLNTLTNRNFYKHVQFDWINDQINVLSFLQVCCYFNHICFDDYVKNSLSAILA
jgi:hypothetical protein